MSTTERFICRTCGYIGYTEKGKEGSVLITFVLLLFYLIPGIIYALWRSSTKYKECAACGSKDIIPLDTPIGQKLYEEVKSSPTASAIPVRLQKKQAFENAKAQNNKTTGVVIFVLLPFVLFVCAFMDKTPSRMGAPSPAASQTANPASLSLLYLPKNKQAELLGKSVGGGCVGKIPFYMGMGKKGISKDLAFWSISCVDGREYTVEINPSGSGKVLECATLKKLNAGQCFTKLVQ